MMMFNVYLVENAQDAIVAAQHGIYDFVIDDSECENCAMVVGPSLDEFFPCVIVMDDKEQSSWPVCVDCAFPTIYPQDWVVEFFPDSGTPF